LIPATFQRSLDAGEHGGVFYLFGDEEFQKDQAVRGLIDAHIDPGTADFNLDRLGGSEIDVERLASVLATPPLMAQWRVVVLRDVEALAGQPRARTALIAVASAPPPGLVLIMVASVPKGSKAKFYSELKKVSRSHEFPALSEGDAPGWLMSHARDHLDLQLVPEAATAIVAALGTDLGILTRELEKLAAVAGDGENVTLEVVQRAGTHILRADRWQWFDQVGRKEFAPALTNLEILLAQGDSGVGLVIGLATQLLRLGIAVEGGMPALEKALPPHQKWLAKRIAGMARGWSGDELAQALIELEDVDRMLKSTPLSDRHLVGTWLLARLAGTSGVAA